MIRRNSRRLALLFAAAILLACLPSFVPAAAPTFDPNSLNTMIVQTADAAALQTALAAPPASATFTPGPTFTPSATPSPTATFLFLLFTPTVPITATVVVPGSTGLKYDCQVILRSPEDGSHMGPKTDFTMDWQVRNVGTETWDANSADYRYRSGDKLHKTSVYDLNSSVSPGGQTEIRVAMKSPGAAGSYSTVWVLKTGSTEFCRMSMSIQVP